MVLDPNNPGLLVPLALLAEPKRLGVEFEFPNKDMLIDASEEFTQLSSLRQFKDYLILAAATLAEDPS